MFKFRKIGVLMLVFVFIISMTGCFGPFRSSDNDKVGSVAGVVTLDEDPVGGVSVSVSDTNKATVTDSKGVYKITDLSTGSYTLYFEKSEVSIDRNVDVVISGGKETTRNLNLTSNNDDNDDNNNNGTSIEDVKLFVSDLKGHGVNLMESGEEQATKIKENINEDVIPYLVAMGYRFDKISEVLRVWETLGEWNGYGPGEYTVNWNEFDNYREMRRKYLGDCFDDYGNWETRDDYDENYYDQYDRYRDYYFAVVNDDYISYEEFLEEHTEFIIAKDIVEDYHSLGVWEWNINFADLGETVSLKVTNPDEISTYERIESEEYDWYRKEKIDFTKAEFSYNHTFDNDDSLDWSLSFTLDTEESEIVEWTDTYERIHYDYVYEGGVYKEVIDIRKYRDDFVFTIPRKATAKLRGTMKDSLTFVDEYGWLEEEGDIPTIGEITVNGEVTLDLDGSKEFNYDGSFNSEEINYKGKTRISFTEMPSYQNIIDGEAYPLLESLYFLGEFSTNVFKISGSTEADFISKEIDGVTVLLPSKVTYSGLYQDISVEDGFTLDGSLVIEPDYIDLDGLIIGGNISLEGDLERANFDRTYANINFAYNGDEDVNLSFRYEFDGGKFIRGTVDIDGEELVAYNEKDLKITLFVDGEDGKIGEITDYYGDELYAEIIIDSNGIPNIHYDDMTRESLLP
ncbi:carboxypeptidase-like regulatory domain-containing protein [Halonatronum saccharophilum]|uniref:carboxypeptidase-like regulatory domain-containing protein n=1 Tax=Halonatronum saccharophilum TaxID=150060 RepID=UPI0004827B95|nr:carboxypeptidase-like regulatory domain-containing protein [Halonatronum saccharophilum]